MRRVAVVTTGRADYGMYRPVLKLLQERPDVELRIVAGGMHVSEAHGLTVRDLERDGFTIAERVDFLEPLDTPEAVAVSAGRAHIGFARAYARQRPDLLLTLGDRFEMHAAVAAAVPFCIPVAHIAGGDVTEGAMDDALRNAISKLAHVHFPLTEAAAERLRAMDEEAWRITVSGAPSLDEAVRFTPIERHALLASWGLDPSVRFVLVTYHPVTLEYTSTDAQVGELLAALEPLDCALVFTAPNADTSRDTIAREIGALAARRRGVHVSPALGQSHYFSALAHADAMIGNSSSGLIEAATFQLPVVNIGDRQRGRLRPDNVIDVPCARAAIAEGVARARSASFRRGLDGLANPYGSGDGARRIVDVLTTVELSPRLLRKRAHAVVAPRITPAHMA